MSTVTAMDCSQFHPLSRESIVILIRSFYSDVRADPELGPVFEAAIMDEWDAHLERMADFWSTVVLRTHSFRGNVYQKHMALNGIKREHFERWLSIWRMHTERMFELNIAREFQEIAEGIGRMLHYGFFDEFPDGTGPRKAEANRPSPYLQ